jgi:hypothetical protein
MKRTHALLLLALPLLAASVPAHAQQTSTKPNGLNQDSCVMPQYSWNAAQKRCFDRINYSKDTCVAPRTWQQQGVPGCKLPQQACPPPKKRRVTGECV